MTPFAKPRLCNARPAAETALMNAASIEVMPRTAAKVDDFTALLPRGSAVYLAHIDGTPFGDMLATATRLARNGFEVVPHLPARSIHDAATLNDWLARYAGDANVTQALVLAGGIDAARGDFSTSMELLETGAFDRAGITRISVAGHPEGNRAVALDGGDAALEAALRWKQAYGARTGAAITVVTQFCFQAAPVIAWAERLAAEGIDLPIRVGLAGPAKLHTLIKYAVTCGVGASLKVLETRALDVTRLLVPYTPDDMLAALAVHCQANPESLIDGIHLFPLGGIDASARWAHGSA